MRLQFVIITLPNFIDNEATIINQIMAQHKQCIVHIRKPDAPAELVDNLINSIDSEHYNRIVIHYNFDLAARYHLGGIHLSGKTPTAPYGWQGRVSASCHSLDEVKQKAAECDYVFLSPIFNSISKNGYNAAFSDAELCEARTQGIITPKVYALGGITPEKIAQISTWGFGGFAVLGDIWRAENADAILNRVAAFITETE
ncbi:MAG: thiamine phosphate synthase [Bacteroidales bacterium]|nr:thiamine phosphate synthase [Bacteroidales bacterium]